MAQHGAFGAPGRARGIDDRRDVVRSALGNAALRFGGLHRVHQCSFAVVSKGQQQRANRVSTFLETLCAVRPCDKKSGRRVLQKIGELRSGVSGVEGHKDRTQAQCGEIQQQRFGRLVDLGKQAVSGT